MTTLLLDLLAISLGILAAPMIVWTAESVWAASVLWRRGRRAR